MKALNLLFSYLSDREQYINYRGTVSDCKPLFTGVPQGSILGPLLFIIYTNDLTNASPLFTTITYADDTTLIYSPDNNINSNTISQTVNNELQNINN